MCSSPTRTVDHGDSRAVGQPAAARPRRRIGPERIPQASICLRSILFGRARLGKRRSWATSGLLAVHQGWVQAVYRQTRQSSPQGVQA